MSTLVTDVRYAVRMLWKDRRFTLVALVALALGIGATSAIYTVVDSVLLRPLPYPEPAALVEIQSATRNGPGASSLPDFEDYRARNHTLSSVAAYYDRRVVLTGSADPQQLDALSVTPGFFDVLGVQPIVGRALGANDAVVGSPSILISYALWQGRFRGDPDIVGRGLSVDGQPAVIVGVMPASFRFPLDADESAQVYLPLPRDSNDEILATRRGLHAISIVGRMKPGTTRARTQADFDAVVATMRVDHPGESEDKNLSAHVYELREQIVAPVRPALVLLLIAVACVLIISCANVAGLLLARATVRRREVAIRATLGATRWRIVRQLLTESALVGIAGGTLGLLLALWLVDALLAFVAPSLPRVHGVAIDARVLAVTTGISLLSSMLFGFMPALQASRVELQETLKQSSRGASGSRRSRNALIVAEIAVALILTFGAGLALRSFASLKRIDPGFRPDGLVMAQVDLPARYPKDADALRYYRALTRSLDALPAADGVALGAPLPFSREGIRSGVHLPGQPPSPALSAARFTAVSPSYFATMGIPLVAGRTFTAADDDEKAAPVLVITQSFAHALFPAGDAIGKHVDVGITTYDDKNQSTTFEIIGIVGDIRSDSLTREIKPAMYGTLGRCPVAIVGVVARSKTPALLLPALRQAILAVDRDLPPALISPMNALLDESIRTERMLMVLLGLFAAIALALATIGIYGVMSYSVTQRRREIGIRVAVGARVDQIVALVLGESLKLAGLGVAIGVAVSLASARLMRGLVFGVRESDPTTLVAVAALLVVVSLTASLIPAWRATRVDPMEALRDE